ncbi:bacteriohemerythrin [Christensenella tenuis]|jgi:hemerythrin|uniref:Hemerythrin family protein n=1 Tax=Christensenella tenuis TaxID=2763033 RepID=A0ABR7EAB6_9FIRM|nr:hemerythrin family protein [Christensenella tenuis]MBC5646740.1 hemerythrin family protein [Christensenella tenuis]
MAYVFTKDLETGIAVIDSQHREIFDAMNRLADACAKGTGRQEIEKMLHFLNNYIAKHFGDEEKMHAQYNYPERIKHKNYHENFKLTVNELIKEYRTDGASIGLVGKLNSKVGMWLLNHIKREDGAFGTYLKSKNG